MAITKGRIKKGMSANCDNCGKELPELSQVFIVGTFIFCSNECAKNFGFGEGS